ncbi:MAG TPA: Na/Pi symporter [Thermaerobacter sp.]
MGGSGGPFQLALGLGGLAGGLGLMTWALRQAGQTSVAMALARLRRAGPLEALLLGLVLTAVMQSSSTFGLLLVGAVGAGWMDVRVAQAAVVGSNLGTTITAHLTAVPSLGLAWTVATAGLVLVLAGLGRPALRAAGLAALGLGAALTGLDMVGRALEPLASARGPVAAWNRLDAAPHLAFIAGVIISATALSSGAVIALLQRVVATGVLPVPASLPVIYGANVGTTSDVLLAALLVRGPALSVAAFHLVLNLVTTIAAAPLSPVLAALCAALSADPARQVAWAHTLFNATGALVVWPWLVRRFHSGGPGK